jgi:tetrapyrrole methylase family protein / MazG family protein
MVTVVGLGPGSLGRVPSPIRDLILDPDRSVIVRTLDHPAAEELSRLREVQSCDDLYQGADYPSVYQAIVARIVEAAASGPVIYAVPGSPTVGEFAVRDLRAAGVPLEIIAGESFVDAILAEVGYDPFDRGLQILNGHELPDPLILDMPTIIGHLDRPEVIADVGAALGRALPEQATVTLVVDAGGDRPQVEAVLPGQMAPDRAGNRTSLFVDTPPGGFVGAVHAMRRLREECPWDREQTHQSLVKYLVEEVYELIDAVARLPEDGVDWGAYADVEDELGDVLLSVLFHEAIAREAGAFDLNDVGETLRQKLVRRHPHVFGDAEVDSAVGVKQQWDRIKEEERGGADARQSALDGVPSSMPALQRASKVQNRAAKVGFDWAAAGEVLDKVAEEVEELKEAMSGRGDVDSELGDLLFSVVNLSRHLNTDSELALTRAVERFATRFRLMELEGPLDGLSLDELNQRWDRAKIESE